jgi:hypothetical protein
LASTEGTGVAPGSQPLEEEISLTIKTKRNCGMGTNLVYTVPVKDVLAFAQFSNLFCYLVVTQTYQATLPVLDLNSASAIQGFCNQGAAVFNKTK